MTDNDNHDVDLDLDGRVVIDKERHEELIAAENEFEEFQEEKESLKEQIDAADEQIGKVRGLYTKRLAELTDFSEEFFEGEDTEVLESELAGQLDVTEEEATEVAVLGMGMPQSVDGEGETITAALCGLGHEESEEVTHLANRADILESTNPEYAAELREKAVEKAGVDEFAELEEVRS